MNTISQFYNKKNYKKRLFYTYFYFLSNIYFHLP